MPASSSLSGDGEASVLRARGLAKWFGPQRALDGVDLTIAQGEVVALLGENGSGKSTLVKILAGYHEPEPGGELAINGRQIPLPVPLGQTPEIGISFVFQDLGLAPQLTALENLFVRERVGGSRRFGRGTINWRAERRRAQAVFDSYRVALDPTAVVGSLRPTAQALLAIVRAADELREFRERFGVTSGGVLVLDEPTVFLPEDEKKFLFELVDRVRADGAGVLFVSHDMTAVREIADRAVVLRDGSKVGDVRIRETTDLELLRLVSGHRLADDVLAADGRGSQGAENVSPDTAVLSASGLSGGGLSDVTFTVAPGEIVGVAGLLGSGSEDLPYALFGALDRAAGELRVGEWSGDAAELDPERAQRLGLALVPGDRKQQGAAANLAVELNMLSLVLGSYVRRGILGLRRVRRAAHERMHEHDVRPRNPGIPMAALSGGNQQKVVLARWLELNPRVLLLHEPTQGVDVATRAEIYELMRERARRGTAMVWVSTDFDELAAVSDRVLVCAQGRIAGELGPPLHRDRITAEVFAAASRGGRKEDGAMHANRH